MESDKREALDEVQLAAKRRHGRTVQALTHSDQEDTVGWLVSTEWCSIKKWRPEVSNTRSGCRGGLDAIARMAGVRCDGALSVAAEW